jgi:hypothetical protein
MVMLVVVVVVVVVVLSTLPNTQNPTITKLSHTHSTYRAIPITESHAKKSSRPTPCRDHTDIPTM